MLVLLPSGYGGHVDHLICLRASAAVLGSEPAAHYADAPYTLRSPTAAPAPGVPDQPRRQVDVSAGLAAKLDACAAYRSQLGYQFDGERAMRRALAAPVERFCGTGALHLPV